MLTALIAAQVITWIFLLLLGVALVALARQVGMLHVRVAPAGALTTGRGPDIGEAITPLPVTTLDGNLLTIGGGLAAGRRQLILFVSAQCPLCKKLIPIARSFAKSERIDLIFAGDDAPEVQQALIEKMDIAAFPFINEAVAGRAFEVEKLPHAVLLDENGVLLSKGLVNSREHLESMVIAQEMGVRSVQDYLNGLKAHAA
jgi:methylamine dehydrogenase accessory protein MauD